MIANSIGSRLMSAHILMTKTSSHFQKLSPHPMPLVMSNAFVGIVVQQGNITGKPLHQRQGNPEIRIHLNQNHLHFADSGFAGFPWHP